MISKYIKKKIRQWKKIKFLKKIVTSCIVFIICYTIIQSNLSYRVGSELTPTLTTCVYAFFGTELVATAFVKIIDEINIKKKTSRRDSNEHDDSDNNPVG